MTNISPFSGTHIKLHSSLFKLKEEAYPHTVGDEGEPSMTSWESEMCKRSSTFLFWDTILRYETLVLMFIRAYRETLFCLYVEVLEEHVHLFFSLHHINYARWVPIHLRDIKSLPASVRKEFEQEGHWVLSKTNNKFSTTPIDQAHEQANKVVKSAGGAVGLTENPVAFR